MKQFILKVNSSKILKVVSCSVSLMLTLIWSIDILFEKLRSEKGDEFEKHPLYYPSGRWEFYAKPVFF